MFGPEYTKINTAFMRDQQTVIVPGEWALPEFGYLADVPWRWYEKVDGTNIRLHWNGSRVTVGGRTDDAMIPATLVAQLGQLTDPAMWRSVFPDADDVTVYGEGYGRGIRSGGQYRRDMAFIVFDVLVGRWWLSPENVADVADKFGLDVVPLVGQFTLNEAWKAITNNSLTSQWDGAQIEGLVGRPLVDLINRKGDRIIVKMKAADWADHQKRGGQVTANAA
jgi:hypothetical protein